MKKILFYLFGVFSLGFSAVLFAADKGDGDMDAELTKALLVLETSSGEAEGGAEKIPSLDEFLPAGKKVVLPREALRAMAASRANRSEETLPGYSCAAEVTTCLDALHNQKPCAEHLAKLPLAFSNENFSSVTVGPIPQQLATFLNSQVVGESTKGYSTVSVEELSPEKFAYSCLHGIEAHRPTVILVKRGDLKPDLTSIPEAVRPIIEESLRGAQFLHYLSVVGLERSAEGTLLFHLMETNGSPLTKSFEDLASEMDVSSTVKVINELLPFKPTLALAGFEIAPSQYIKEWKKSSYITFGDTRQAPAETQAEDGNCSIM